MFRSRADADITLGCYRQHPVLIRDGGATLGPDVRHALPHGQRQRAVPDCRRLRRRRARPTTAGHGRRGDRSLLPLYEAKMLSHWNNRFSTYEDATQAQLNVGTLPRLTAEQLDDPDADVLARYWVDEDAVLDAVPEWWDRDWLFGWRDIARASEVAHLRPQRAAALGGGSQVPAGVPPGPDARAAAAGGLVVDGVRLRRPPEAQRHRHDLLHRQAARLPDPGDLRRTRAVGGRARWRSSSARACWS